MTFDFYTVLAVVRRLSAYRARPTLFHDKRLPAAIARRWARLYAWMGFTMRGLVFEALAGRYSPPAGSLVCMRRKIEDVPLV